MPGDCGRWGGHGWGGRGQLNIIHVGGTCGDLGKAGGDPGVSQEGGQDQDRCWGLIHQRTLADPLWPCGEAPGQQCRLYGSLGSGQLLECLLEDEVGGWVGANPTPPLASLHPDGPICGQQVCPGNGKCPVPATPPQPSLECPWPVHSRALQPAATTEPALQVAGAAVALAAGGGRGTWGRCGHLPCPSCNSCKNTEDGTEQARLVSQIMHFPLPAPLPPPAPGATPPAWMASPVVPVGCRAPDTIGPCLLTTSCACTRGVGGARPSWARTRTAGAGPLPSLGQPCGPNLGPLWGGSGHVPCVQHVWHRRYLRSLPALEFYVLTCLCPYIGLHRQPLEFILKVV